MNDDRAIQVAVNGVVQGVGFRYFTQRAAGQFGVVGWVRNLSNGSVEVMAQGPRSAMDAMIEFLKTGPPHAHVTSVQITEKPVDPTLTRFEVTF